jgi:hypothetical protein
MTAEMKKMYEECMSETVKIFDKVQEQYKEVYCFLDSLGVKYTTDTKDLMVPNKFVLIMPWCLHLHKYDISITLEPSTDSWVKLSYCVDGVYFETYIQFRRALIQRLCRPE